MMTYEYVMLDGWFGIDWVSCNNKLKINDDDMMTAWLILNPIIWIEYNLILTLLRQSSHYVHTDPAIYTVLVVHCNFTIS